MTTRVVSIYRDPYDVYIGRAGKGQRGTFGNPWITPADGTLEEVLARFEAYFVKRVELDPEFRLAVQRLKGRVLGCFCAGATGLTATDRPWRCHGQIIAAVCDGALLPGGILL